jgi:hypothetical protein
MLKELFTLEMLNFAIVGAAADGLAMFIGHFFDGDVPRGSIMGMLGIFALGTTLCYFFLGSAQTIAFGIGGYLILVMALFVGAILCGLTNCIVGGVKATCAKEADHE